MPQQSPMTPEQYAAMEPDKVLFTMRIIAIALIVGVLTFGGIASFIVFGMAQPVQPPAGRKNAAEILMYLGLAGAALMVVVSFVIPNLLANGIVKGVVKLVQNATSAGSKELFSRLLMAAQVRMIVALAFIEGAAFFNLLVAFIVARSLISLAIVAGLLVVMAIHFPTKMKLARWLEEQQRALS